MSIYKTRNHLDWKSVKGDFQREPSICARCGNEVSYRLVYDADEIGYLGLLTLKHNKRYAFKCPICPQYEEVAEVVAKNIIKGNIF